ncbi:hypothetical protein Tco_0242325 [Tanacetum coccineum]
MNSIGAHYLPHPREYVGPPSIDIVRPWFETIGYGETVPVKGTLKKSILPPRWRLLMAQIIQCLGGKTGGFDHITNKDAIILYNLANGINIDYSSIFWEDIIIKLNKRHREKVIPYTRFLSLLMMHKIKEGYRDGELAFYPTQVFSVNNWALKPNQPEEPLFTNHMLAICSATEPVVFKAPKPFTNAERVSQGTKLRAKPGYKNHSTSSKQPSLSSKEETKASFIIYSESTSGNDASAVSTAEVDLGKSAPSIDPHVLADKTQSISEGLEIVLTQPTIGKGASSIARQVEEDETSRTIKLEDLAKLVSCVQPSFKDLDSLEDDHIIVVDDSDEDKEAAEVHATTNVKTEDTSVPKSSSPSDSDDETHVTGSMVETSRIKKLKKFDSITEEGKHIHLIEEQINQQKKIEEEAKAKAVKQEGEVRKECRSLFLQNILDLYFKHFKLPEDVVNRILQVVLDLQHFKSSPFIFAATILQSSSAIHHISNIDNYVHQIIEFQSILITSSHSLWSSQSFGHQKGVCPWLTENHFNSQYMKHWASQSFGT